MRYLWIVFFLWGPGCSALKLYAQTTTHAYWINTSNELIYITQRKDQKLVLKCPIKNPQAIHAYNNQVCVLSGEKNETILTFIDQVRIVSVDYLGVRSDDFTIWKNKAFFISVDGNLIHVWNFDTRTFEPSLSTSKACSIVSNQGRLYVSSLSCGTISIFDLSCPESLPEIIRTIRTPIEIHLLGGFAYVVDWAPQSVHKVNLATFNIEKLYKYNMPASKYVFLGKHLYIYTARIQEIEIIELFTGSVTIESFSFGPHMFASDCAIYKRSLFDEQYVVVRLITPFFEELKLFDFTYKGIEGKLWGEGEQEFQGMKEALQSKNFELAKVKFHEALGFCHKKAYAIAALAFMHGVLGAEKDINLGFEFWQHADRDYYELLCGTVEKDIVSSLTQNGLE